LRIFETPTHKRRRRRFHARVTGAAAAQAGTYAGAGKPRQLQRPGLWAKRWRRGGLRYSERCRCPWERQWAEDLAGGVNDVLAGFANLGATLENTSIRRNGGAAAPNPILRDERLVMQWICSFPDIRWRADPAAADAAPILPPLGRKVSARTPQSWPDHSVNQHGLERLLFRCECWQPGSTLFTLRMGKDSDRRNCFPETYWRFWERTSFEIASASRLWFGRDFGHLAPGDLYRFNLAFGGGRARAWPHPPGLS